MGYCRAWLHHIMLSAFALWMMRAVFAMRQASCWWHLHTVMHHRALLSCFVVGQRCRSHALETVGVVQHARQMQCVILLMPATYRGALHLLIACLIIAPINHFAKVLMLKKASHTWLLCATYCMYSNAKQVPMHCVSCLLRQTSKSVLMLLMQAAG